MGRDLSLRCELLSARAPKGDVPDEPVVRPARSRAELQTALDALARCRREAQSTFDYTSGRCRAIGDAADKSPVSGDGQGLEIGFNNK